MKMKNRYKLLQYFWIVISFICFLIVILEQQCINSWKMKAAKNRSLFILMDQWVYMKQEGKNLQTYFKKKNYKKIAIYGMGDVGLRLVKELKYSGIEISYGIDRNAQNIYSDIKLVTLEDELTVVDAIVVTLTDGFDEIFDVLQQRVKCPIIAIEDILNEI